MWIIYPLLKQMERLGSPGGKKVVMGGARALRHYRLTTQGDRMLDFMRGQIREPDDEVARDAESL